jgi:hypothetical protein
VLFCPKPKILSKGDFKKGVKTICLKIVFVNKPSIIETPYTKIKSEDVLCVGKLRYAK